MSAATAGSQSTSAFSYQGSFSSTHCGYCETDPKENPPLRSSFYLRTKVLTVRHYQCLVDRGWRRSGTTLYKPHITLSCCKHYTIRLHADTFKASRDQRQCLHKWTRNVLGEDYIREAAKKYPKSKEEKKKQNNSFNLAESVHAPEYSTIESSIPPEPAHKFEVTLEPASFSDEKYEVYENYQRNVHKEEPHEISAAGFKRFLCESPLPTTTTESGKRFGSYHMCYRLDGRLIAMGVLDLLPDVVSGVYFIYHNDFESWHLGKVSACHEACLAKEGGYGCYYMGYYIPSCQKMRYKATYGPSELLDPSTNVWVPLTADLKSSLEADSTWSNRFSGPPPDLDIDPSNAGAGFSIDSQMPGIMSQEELDEFDLGAVKVAARTFQTTADNLQGFEDTEGILYRVVRETVATVGPEVAREMVLRLG